MEDTANLQNGRDTQLGGDRHLKASSNKQDHAHSIDAAMNISQMQEHIETVGPFSRRVYNIQRCVADAAAGCREHYAI